MSALFFRLFTFFCLACVTLEGYFDDLYWNYGCGINPGVPPCIECGVTGELSYLYWKPYQDNNQYVTVITPINESLANINVEQHHLEGAKTTNRVKDVKYDWDSGFRLKLGYALPCYNWSVEGSWNHFVNHSSSTFNTNLGIVLPFFVPNIDYNGSTSADLYGNANARWKLSLNEVDITLRREFILGFGVTFAPYIGLRALYLKEDYHIETTQEFTQEQTNTIDTSSKLHEDFRSFGLLVGLRTRYDLFCGIGFVGEMAISSLYGNLKTDHYVQSNYLLTGGTRDSDSGSLDALRNVNCLRNTLDLSLGLEWHTLYNCMSRLFYFRMAWEHHTFFDQNNFLTIEQGFFQGNSSILTSGRPTGGNLYLYGWTFTAGITF